MIELITEFLKETVYFFNEVAIYLVFGFFVAGVLHIVFPERFIHRHIGGSNFSSVIKASLAGIPLPLCSCGVIPVAASLRKKGASRGASLSFLVSTPQIGVDSFLVTYSLIGWLFGVVRIVASFITAMVSGVVSNLFDKKSETKKAVPEIKPKKMQEPVRARAKTFFSYIQYELLGSFANYLIIGFLIAAAIAAFVPESFFEIYLNNQFLSMIIMLAVGIPMYVCATASTPIAASLLLKGISPGAALVFLLAGPATNAITITTIIKSMGKRAAVIYLASIAGVSILLGYGINYLTFQTSMEVMGKHQHEILPEWLKLTGSVILLLMLGNFYIRKWFFGSKQTDNIPNKVNYKSLSVEGMTCEHCAERVRNAVRNVEGTNSVSVNLKDKKVYFKSDKDNEDRIVKVIEENGYEVKKR